VISCEEFKTVLKRDIGGCLQNTIQIKLCDLKRQLHVQQTAITVTKTKVKPYKNCICTILDVYLLCPFQSCSCCSQQKIIYTPDQKSLVLLDPLSVWAAIFAKQFVSNFAGTWEAISRIYVPRLFTMIGLQYVRRVLNNVILTNLHSGDRAEKRLRMSVNSRRKTGKHITKMAEFLKT